jgi:hypothetical protein
MISTKGAKTKQPHFEEMGLLLMSAPKQSLHSSLDLALEGSSPDFLKSGKWIERTGRSPDLQRNNSPSLPLD